MAELALGSLNRARYAGLDFDTHNDDLRARLQVKYAADFNDFAIASLGIMLLDLTAYGLDTLSFYLDRRATDTYLATARTRKSVARTARQLGYPMGGAVASGVDLDMTIDEVFSFDIPVPAGFQFDGPDGLLFETAEETLFTIAEQGLAAAPKVISCYEGETIHESFVSDGTPAQLFELRRVPDDKFVVQGTVEVVVDGAAWKVVDLLEHGATDQFEVGFNDDPETIRCGDGLAGNIPTAGASIEVTYVASRGKAGQVAGGTIEEETSPLIVAFTEIPITITNPEGSVGGDDRETLASAKAFAPKVWKSRQVAVTGEDYEGLGGSYADPLFGRVAVAKAISSRSAASDLTIQNFIVSLQVAIDALNVSLTTSTTAIDTSLDSIDASVTGIASAASTISSATSTIQTEVASGRTNLRAAKDKTTEITVDASDIIDLVSDTITQIEAYGPSGTGDLSTLQEDTLIDLVNRIDVEGSNILAASPAAESSMDAAISNFNLIEDQTSLPPSDITTAVTAITTESTSIGTESTSVRTETAAIDTNNAALVATADDAYDGINEHLDKLLAADCKANLVTVPILVRDSGGFYTAPSMGLIHSLQTFLNTKKEVTQTVAVTSGENFLIAAVVRARVGVLSNYSEAVVKTAVEAVISGVLRDRAFGVSLYESDLDDVILEVEGVSFVNARIEGYLDTDGVTVLTARLDSDGNLIILTSEIISRGTITITTEPVTT